MFGNGSRSGAAGRAEGAECKGRSYWRGGKSTRGWDSFDAEDERRLVAWPSEVQPPATRQLLWALAAYDNGNDLWAGDDRFHLGTTTSQESSGWEIMVG